MGKHESKILKAIRTLENSGLKVYRSRHKDRAFMKVYTEPLKSLLNRISGNALKVFIALGGEMDFEDTIVEMTRKEIHEVTGLHEHTIREALNELEKLGLISRIGPNNRRKYVLSQMYVKKGK